MNVLMARGAERDQILSRVIPELTPPLNVMYLKILHAPTGLASPAVSLQDFTAQQAIGFRVKP